MNDEQQPSFMDSKTLLAVTLSVVIFFGWSAWMSKKYPNQKGENGDQIVQKEKTTSDKLGENSQIDSNALNNQNKDQSAHAIQSGAENNNVSSSNNEYKNPEKVTPQKTLEKFIPVDTENWSFSISSKGMGLKDIVLKKYFDREKNLMKLGPSKGPLPFETHLSGYQNYLYFDIQKVTETEYKGVALFNQLKITKVLKLLSETYSIKTSVIVENIDDKYSGLSIYLTENLNQAENGGLLSADMFNVQDVFINLGGSNEREIIHKDEPLNKSYTSVQATSVGSQYFTLAFANESSIYPELKVKTLSENQTVSAVLVYPRMNNNREVSVDYISYLGPKSMDILSSVSDSFTDLIDLGFFSFIASVLLKILVLFNGFLGNWGVSIILVTLLVRLLLLPTNISSFKSMRNMSKLSPLMKNIREKYKDNPEKRNLEIMALYKQHKVNPVGGCLPMLLQIPVFFALYQVLGRSIELYQASFMFWIQDLSAKDPYYVLPVLMGITMFFQQKLTPSTMDPAQAKVMMFMPLMFSFFMLALPSGLTLYMFISGLFGIIQQLILARENSQLQEDPKVITIK